MVAYAGSLPASPLQTDEFGYIADELHQYGLDYWPPHVSTVLNAPAGFYNLLLPVSPDNIRGYAGSLARGYERDLYHRVHIIPNSINIGTVAAEQFRTVEVWNAQLMVNTLTAIVAQNATGMTLLGPIAPPSAFNANASRIYNLSVIKNGPRVINAAFLFEFTLDMPSLLVTGRRSVPFPFGPNWEQPVIERLEWLTEILESRAGIEQRIRIRQGPRREFEYRLRVANDKQRVLLENLLIGGQARAYSMPVWPDQQIAATTIASGALTIPVVTQYRDFEIDNLVALVNGVDIELAEISAVLANSLTIKSPLNKTWPAGSRIIPARSASLQQTGLQFEYFSDAIGDSATRFSVDLEWTIPAITETADYRGLPVLLTRTNWSASLHADYSRKTREIDFLVGLRVLDDQSDFSRIRRSHRFFLNGSQAIFDFRVWLQARSGRLKPFWLPSHQNDLMVLNPVASSSTALQVEHRGYAQNTNSFQARRDIMIETNAGQRYYRRITAATDNVTSEDLVIDSPLGVTLQPSDIRRVSFMPLVRLDADAVEIAHHTDQLAEASLTVITLKEAA